MVMREAAAPLVHSIPCSGESWASSRAGSSPSSRGCAPPKEEVGGKEEKHMEGKGLCDARRRQGV